MKPESGSRFRQIANEPLVRAAIGSLALHAALLFGWVSDPGGVGLVGYVADRTSVPYDATRTAAARLEIDFRSARDWRESATSGQRSVTETQVPLLVVDTPSSRSIAPVLPLETRSPGQRPFSVRGGGNDCWVNGFRFCSS